MSHTFRTALVGVVIGIMAVSSLSGCGGCGGAGPSRLSQLPAEIQQALEEGESFVLVSLDPVPVGAAGKPTEPAEAAAAKDKLTQIDQWKALGSTTITDANERMQLVAALRRGIEESDGTAAACFNPRHAIRVAQGGKTYDLVICFECLSATIYTDGQRSGSFQLTASPQGTFNASLSKAGLAVPE